MLVSQVQFLTKLVGNQAPVSTELQVWWFCQHGNYNVLLVHSNGSDGQYMNLPQLHPYGFIYGIATLQCNHFQQSNVLRFQQFLMIMHVGRGLVP